MALQQRCPFLLDEVRIWSAALTAFDVGVHVIGDGGFDPFWGYSALKSSTWTIARARSTQFIEDELVNVIVVPVHHGHDLVEVAKDRV